MTRVCIPLIGWSFSNQGTDQALPSFGSRSDVDMLFASAQRQAMTGPVEQEVIGSQFRDTHSAAEPDLPADGNVSRECLNSTVSRPG